MSAGIDNINLFDLQSGSANSLNAIIGPYVTADFESISVQVTGTYNASFTFEGSNDGTNWFPVNGSSISNASKSVATTYSSNDIYQIPIAFTSFRIRISSYVSGTINVNYFVSENAPNVFNTKAKIDGGTGTISILNSSVTPLAANAVFTGAWEEVLDYGSISVMIRTDRNSAVNGVSFELSSDGVNIDSVHQYTRDTSALPSGGVGIFPVKSRYFRVKYTNGNQAQGFFRMQVIYRPFPAGPTNMIATQITDTSAALITRSVITGKDSSGGGNFVNIKAKASGSLMTAIGDISDVQGQKTMATSFPTTIASDQSPIPVYDTPNQTGVNTILNLTTTAIEGKVSTNPLTGRKYVNFQALAKNVKWGWDSSCPFDAFKNQYFHLPAGVNCKIYFKTSTGTATLSFGEC